MEIIDNKLPKEIKAVQKTVKGEVFADVFYTSPEIGDDGLPMFFVSISHRDEAKAKEQLLASLKSNPVGYDELTRKFK